MEEMYLVKGGSEGERQYCQNECGGKMHCECIVWKMSVWLGVG
jgi:hypothetical protein